MGIDLDASWSRDKSSASEERESRSSSVREMKLGESGVYM